MKVVKKKEFDPDDLRQLFVVEDSNEPEIDEEMIMNLFLHPGMLDDMGGSADKISFLGSVMEHLVGCEECRLKAQQLLASNKDVGKVTN